MGHWEYHSTFDPAEWYGFIYCITELPTGKKYIGKKQFRHKLTKPPLKGKKNRRIEHKESDWKTYTGSSNKLNATIEVNGIQNYKFQIIELCSSKGDLAYYEAKTMWSFDALTATLPNGEYEYYNEQIPAVRGRWKKP